MPYQSSTPSSSGETVVIQVQRNGSWMDYSRCTPAEAYQFLERKVSENDDKRWRAVDWITFKVIEMKWLV